MIAVPDLPYAYDALEPALSKEQVECHYEKHTRKYYDKVNELIKGTIFEDATDINSIVSKKTLTSVNSILFNNMAQAWNHTFFWNSLAPSSGSPSDELKHLIDIEFGSMTKFKQSFVEKATTHFGSGWCWLINKNGKLLIKTTPNAGTPLTTADERPLFCMDLWEHSYYLQYQADRAGYIKALWEHINWDFINDNYAAND
jgi:Fe-Mn family superoxide dismutase